MTDTTDGSTGEAREGVVDATSATPAPDASRAAEAAATTPETPAGSFDDVVLPHLDAASRLARWLLRNDDAAEDVVQEASLRALRYFGTFTGGNARAWFLRIVRNTCAGWRTRAVLAERLGIDTDEAASIVRLVQSQLEVSIARHLGPAPRRPRG